MGLLEAIPLQAHFRNLSFEVGQSLLFLRDHGGWRAIDKARVAELQSSLSEVVGDLEMRSHLKRGEDYGLVDVSNGVYMRAKHALGQLEGEAE